MVKAKRLAALLLCNAGDSLDSGHCQWLGVTDRPVLPRPYQGSPIGDVQKRDGGLTPKSEVRLGGTEGANGLSPMRGKGCEGSRGGQGSSYRYWMLYLANLRKSVVSSDCIERVRDVPCDPNR